jgi:hypothetical protein
VNAIKVTDFKEVMQKIGKEDPKEKDILSFYKGDREEYDAFMLIKTKCEQAEKVKTLYEANQSDPNHSTTDLQNKKQHPIATEKQTNAQIPTKPSPCCTLF